MKKKDLKDLKAVRERLRKEIGALDLAIRESEMPVPCEPSVCSGPAVVTFTKRFGDAHSRGYVYAAIGYLRAPRVESGRRIGVNGAGVPATLSRDASEVKACWSSTGSSGLTNVSWAELMEFVKSDEGEHVQWVLNSVRAWNPPARFSNSSSVLGW